MNLHLVNIVGLSFVTVLFIVYFCITEVRIRRAEDIAEGYSGGMDFLTNLNKIDCDRADLAEAKCKAYSCIFGNDPLYYHAAARRNAVKRLGCEETPVVAVDLDGVILKYDKDAEWGGPLVYGEPIPGVIEGLEALRRMGFTISVYTTRVNPIAVGNQGFTLIEQVNMVASYLKAWKIPFDYISLFKPLASYYIDDRAIRFTNWDKAVKDIAKLEAKNESNS